MPNKILLDIKDLDVYYGGIHALHRINMVVEQGEIVSIIGANGAGKSTLLNTIAGDKDKKNGAIIFEGAPAPTRAHQSVERGIVLVPEGRRIFVNLTVKENLRAGAFLEKRNGIVNDLYTEVFDLFPRLKERQNQMGGTLSGGEQQRIAIARAILKNAPILILDEATSAADPENQVEIDKAIENLCKGKTVIVVAHRLGALKMCNRVAVVENHSITSVGTHDEVRQDNAYYNQAWTDYETARNITYQLEGGADHA